MTQVFHEKSPVVCNVKAFQQATAGALSCDHTKDFWWQKSGVTHQAHQPNNSPSHIMRSGKESSSKYPGSSGKQSWKLHIACFSKVNQLQLADFQRNQLGLRECNCCWQTMTCCLAKHRISFLLSSLHICWTSSLFKFSWWRVAGYHNLVDANMLIIECY